MSLEAELRDAADHRYCIDLTIWSEDEDDDYRGFVLMMSKDFVLIQSVEELNDDGMLVFPLSRLSGIDRSDIHGDIDEILRSINFQMRSAPDWISLDSWRGFLSAIESRNILINLIDKDGEIEIGRIAEITEDAVIMKGLDGGGNILSDPVIVPLGEIVAIGFGGRYVSVLQEYVDIKDVFGSEGCMN